MYTESPEWLGALLHSNYVCRGSVFFNKKMSLTVRVPRENIEYDSVLYMSTHRWNIQVVLLYKLSVLSRLCLGFLWCGVSFWYWFLTAAKSPAMLCVWCVFLSFVKIQVLWGCLIPGLFAAFFCCVYASVLWALVFWNVGRCENHCVCECACVFSHFWKRKKCCGNA